jgi:hypothetical protein
MIARQCFSAITFLSLLVYFIIDAALADFGAVSMGELANPRYERFAQELAAGNTADGAYEAAGYRKHRGNAARLSANENIKNRVREVQAVGAEYAAVTLQSLIDEAEQARIKAMESPNGAAAAVRRSSPACGTRRSISTTPAPSSMSG